MCPEYGIYHTRLPQEKKGFLSDETVQFIPLTDVKVGYTVLAHAFNLEIVFSLASS